MESIEDRSLDNHVGFLESQYVQFSNYNVKFRKRKE